MTDGFKQTCLVKPMHPIKSLPLQRLDGLPGPFLANQLRFVKPIDRLSQCIVVAVAAATTFAVQGFAADATPAASASAKTSFSCVSPGPNALSL